MVPVFSGRVVCYLRREMQDGESEKWRRELILAPEPLMMCEREGVALPVLPSPFFSMSE